MARPPFTMSRPTCRQLLALRHIVAPLPPCLVHQPPCLRAPYLRWAHIFLGLHAGRYWTLLEELHEEWQPEKDPLPSDCRFRRDLALLAAGDVKGAQVAKEALEQQQRQDAKLRGIH